jgi:DNA repair exonuclease SbcCD ATPase subunit
LKLRRVEIRNFRRLAECVALEGLDDGLTLVSGDNEEGKSTVLAALKAAFFEHHAVGGAVREAMAPHGGGTPEITVEFEVAGERYALRKAFRRTGGIMLETPARRLVDDEAEQALQRLLRFERRHGKTETKPQHLGLQAVFWIDQGTTFNGMESLTASRDRLAGAIEAEVGAVIGGERARRLIEQVKLRCGQYWTGGWKETGTFRKSREEVERLERERTELRARQRDWDDKVDRLAKLRDERRRAIAADELGRARARVLTLRASVAAIDSLEERCRRAEAEVAAKVAEWQHLDAMATARQRLVDQKGEIARQLAAADAERRRALEDVAAADAAERAAIAAEAAAVNRLAEVEEARLRATRRRDLAAAELELARVRAEHDAAQQAAARLREVRAKLEHHRGTRKRIELIRKAEAVRGEAAAALRAVATRLELVPRPGAAALIDGAPVDPAEPLLLTEPTELELEPFGRIVVLPGGGDVAERRAALRQAELDSARALEAAGAADPLAAEALLASRERLEQERERHERELGHVLRRLRLQTLDELTARVAVLEQKVLELRAVAGPVAVGASAPEADAVIAGIEAELARLEDERATRQKMRDAAAVAARGAATYTARQREAHGRLAERHEQLSRQAEAMERQLVGQEQQLLATVLAERLAAAAGARTEAEAAFEALGRQLAQTDPEGVRDRLKLAERSCEELAQERDRLERQIESLEAELRGMGADRFGERLAEVEAELERAAAELERIAREARAWRLVHDALAEADAAARDAFLAPIRNRLAPYLHQLLPDAEPVLDPKTLTLTHLRRGTFEEPFASLSLGTREQLAVLVRIAFARLLLEREGETSCLILDDALVYADENRFETMKVILERAARELQIIVLTCRPRDYAGLSARHLRLEDCRVPGRSADAVGGR